MNTVGPETGVLWKARGDPPIVIRQLWNGRAVSQFLCCLHNERITIMDREHVKGAADKAKGAIKEGAGKVTGDKSLEAEGKIDKAKGSAHNAAGDMRDAADAAREAADAAKK